jgi:hypothetical protein
MKKLRLAILLMILAYTVKMHFDQKNEEMTPPEVTVSSQNIQKKVSRKEAEALCDQGIQFFLDSVFMKCMDSCLIGANQECQPYEPGSYCRNIVKEVQKNKLQDNYELCIRNVSDPTS